jgi:CubicO group peptidase (beta-lactamase class C family)
MPFLSVLALSLTFASPQTDAQFDRKIEEIMAKSKLPGCAIAYAVNGQVRFAKGYGFANVEHKVRMKAESVHELASVSKQFTAVCILQLAEKGKLKLEDPLSKFFEGAHADWQKVTVRNLLQHTGGLPDYLNALGDPSKSVSEKELVDSIKDKPLVFEPGSKWAYSNSGYMILGLIVAKTSGVSFAQFLRANVFLPAGMRTAVYNDTLAVVPNRADGYTVRNGQIGREDFTSSSLSGTGDGEIMASALDMVAWDVALRNGKVLSPAMQKLMNEVSEPSRKTAPKDVKGYGFGVMLADAGGKLVQTHNGGWMGTLTSFTRYVDDKKCLVVLCNSDRAPLGEIVKACKDRFRLD